MRCKNAVGIYRHKRTCDETDPESNEAAMFTDGKDRLDISDEALTGNGDAGEIVVRDVERIRKRGEKKKKVLHYTCDLLRMFRSQS